MSITTSSFAVETRGLRKSFGKTEIVRGIDLAVPIGQRCAIIGPNGAGKTTLFNMLSGRFAPTSGDILLHGQSVVGKRPFEIYRSGLARSFQITNIFPRLTVFQNLRCAVMWAMGYRYSFLRRVSALKDANERAQALLVQIRLQHRQDTLAGVLPYAEQRALEIGITVAGGANVILLDEPTAGMSRSESDTAVELIRELTRDKTLLMVEHDMGVVFGLADTIAVVVYGQLIAHGTPSEVRADPSVQEAYLGAPAESLEAA